MAVEEVVTESPSIEEAPVQDHSPGPETTVEAKSAPAVEEKQDTDWQDWKELEEKAKGPDFGSQELTDREAELFRKFKNGDLKDPFKAEESADGEETPPEPEETAETPTPEPPTPEPPKQEKPKQVNPDALKNAHELIRRLAEGDQQALAWAQQNVLGRQPQAPVPPPQATAPSLPEIDESKLADPETYAYVKALQQQVDQMREHVPHIQYMKEKLETDTVMHSIRTELVETAVLDPDLYGLKPDEVGALFDASRGTGNLPERITNSPLGEVFNLADKLNIPMKEAHKIYAWEHRGDLAAKNGAPKGPSQPVHKGRQVPSLSTKPAGGAVTREFSNKQLAEMASGNRSLPASWKDERGMLSTDKIPGYAAEYFDAQFG